MKESHVKDILKKWFKDGGYEVLDPDKNAQIGSEVKVDLIAKKADEQWIIEAKGDYKDTSHYYVNFNTGGSTSN